ncbi:MAG: hypothetical protein EKK55_12465 [Rhodocyclaceae bacterium]|nr:MAG: hypothetical protein EKK55_12465 [Rhodocyclaceae bacterium]
MTATTESLLAELAAARMAANRARHCADRAVERLDHALAAAYEAGVPGDAATAAMTSALASGAWQWKREGNVLWLRLECDVGHKRPVTAGACVGADGDGTWYASAGVTGANLMYRLGFPDERSAVEEAERVLDLLFGHGWVVERPAEVTSEGEGQR